MAWMVLETCRAHFERIPQPEVASRQVWTLSYLGGGGGGGFTRPIPRDGGADQFRGIPIVGDSPWTGPEVHKRRGVAENGPTQRV